MIQWNASFEVGNRFIDSEHRILFEVANELAADQINTLARFKEIYLELMQYTSLHFSNEELLMKDIGYPGLVVHAQSHRMIIEEMQALLKRPATLEDLEGGLSGLLNRWITSHILREDMGYRPALVEWKRKRLGI